MSVYIGIDVGTSGVKVIAIDEKAKLLASATEEYPLYAPQSGWTQQDPADWWEGTKKACLTVMSKIDRTQIKAIGTTGQMHGMVCLGTNGEVLTPAILWNDQRTAPQCERIVETVGGRDALLELTNNPCLTGFTIGKVAWLKDNLPEIYGRTRTVFCPKDYIRYLLTGKVYTDVSEASGTGYFDVKNGKWSNELLSRIGLAEIITALPEVLESTENAGSVTAEAEVLTGLPAGTPVAAGGGDAVISSVAMGIVGSDRLAVTLGTGGVVAQHIPAFAYNEGAKLQSSRACLPGMYHRMGVMLAASGSNAWYKSLGSASFKELDKSAETSQPGANGVLFMPYINGERCPVSKADATGAFLGLTQRTVKADFDRAVLEGVAFGLKHVFEQMDASATTSLVLAGGGAVSPLWRQIVADVFNLPVIVLEAAGEGSSFGAAILAGLLDKAWESAEEILYSLQPSASAAPIAANTEVYAAAFGNYKKAAAWLLS
ncbi:MAG: xylulokinase [Oscillospiraceae bacterium]|jgi:xylulokinase|nr:xylulokinase [Oscillospiraceae bacterium]